MQRDGGNMLLLLPFGMSTTGTVALRLAIALGIGLLIGAERERRKGEGASPSPAGIRTFGLTCLLGDVSLLLGGEVLLERTFDVEPAEFLTLSDAPSLRERAGATYKTLSSVATSIVRTKAHDVADEYVNLLEACRGSGVLRCS
jgi:MgtC family